MKRPPKPKPVPCATIFLTLGIIFLSGCVVPSESHTLNLATGSFEGSSVWTGKDTKAKYSKKITRLGEDGKPIVEETTLELDRKTRRCRRRLPSFRWWVSRSSKASS